MRVLESYCLVIDSIFIVFGTFLHFLRHKWQWPRLERSLCLSNNFRTWTTRSIYSTATARCILHYATRTDVVPTYGVLCNFIKNASNWVFVIVLGNVKILGICTIITIVVIFDKLVTIAFHRKKWISYLEIRISDEVWDKEIRKSKNTSKFYLR
jgi:hypothetical protein